jgi:hypothetical protein
VSNKPLTHRRVNRVAPEGSGESPELFQATRDFLVEEFNGRFGLHLFKLQDETMPVCRSTAFNWCLEKLIDRLGMSAGDFGDRQEVTRRQEKVLRELREYGVVVAP